MSENKSPNALVKDKDTRILLDRRAEIREQINKLEAEYQAIEHILMKAYRHNNPTGIEIDMEIARLQKLKEKENKFNLEER